MRILWAAVAVACAIILALAYHFSNRYSIASGGALTVWRVDGNTGQVSYCGVITHGAAKSLECAPVKEAAPPEASR